MEQPPDDDLPEEQKEDTKASVESQDITGEQLTACWNTYAEILLKKGRDNLYSLMTMVSPELSAPDVFEVSVVNDVQKDKLSDEKLSLLEYIKKELKVPSLQMKISVQKKQAGQKNFPYTDKEKFNRMAEKNPILNKLKQQFDLEIEF